MYEVTRQDAHGGQVLRTLQTSDYNKAVEAFQKALREGAIFAEVYNLDEDWQEMVQYPEMKWV